MLLTCTILSPPAAFGVMMWEVATGSAAFKRLHYGGFYQAVVVAGQRPALPPGMPPDYAGLMQQVRGCRLFNCFSAQHCNGYHCVADNAGVCRSSPVLLCFICKAAEMSLLCFACCCSAGLVQLRRGPVPISWSRQWAHSLQHGRASSDWLGQG